MIRDAYGYPLPFDEVKLDKELQAFIFAVKNDIVRFDITLFSDFDIHLFEYLTHVDEVCRSVNLLENTGCSDDSTAFHQVVNYVEFVELLTNNHFINLSKKLVVNTKKVTTYSYSVAETINNVEFIPEYKIIKFINNKNKIKVVNIFDENNLINILYSNGGSYSTPFKDLKKSDLCQSINKIEIIHDRDYFDILDTVLLIYSTALKIFKSNDSSDWYILNRLNFKLNEKVIKSINSPKFVLLSKIKEINHCNSLNEHNIDNYQKITFETINKVFCHISNDKVGYVDLKPTQCINKIWQLEFENICKYNKDNLVSKGKYTDLSRKDLLSIQANPRIYSDNKNYKNLIVQLFRYFENDKFIDIRPWWYYKLALFIVGNVQHIDDTIPSEIL